MRRVMTLGLAFGLAMAPAALNAQGRMGARRAVHGPELVGNPAERVLSHREALGLTAAQVTQLERIRDRVKAQNEPLMKQLAAARPEVEARRMRPGATGPGMLLRRRAAQLSTDERAALRDTARARLQARREALSKLTPEQRAALRDTARARIHGRRPAAPLLTPEQRAQLRDTTRARLQARRAEVQNMTAEQRAELRAQRQERVAGMRQKVEAVRPIATQLRQNLETSRNEVEGVLTSEQLAKLQALRPKHGRGGGPAR